jgi:hypothetical protein
MQPIRLSRARITARLALATAPLAILAALTASPAFAANPSCQWGGQTFTGTQGAGGIPFTCTQGTNGPYWNPGSYTGAPDTLPSTGISAGQGGQNAPGYSPGALQPDENGDMWQTTTEPGTGDVYWSPSGTIDDYNWGGVNDDPFGGGDGGGGGFGGLDA